MSDLKVLIGADNSQLNSALAQSQGKVSGFSATVEKQLTQLDGKIGSFSQSAGSKIETFTEKISKIGDIGGKLTGLGAVLSASVTLPLTALASASIKAYGDIQSLQMGLEAVMGSAERASAEFVKLKEVAKLPGLGLKEAAQGSVSLQAAGFSADQARRSLMAFGNALATVGKGANEMNLVILALTQLQNKSSGFGQDLRQLTEQLPQLRGALTEAFGTADSEAIAKSGRTGKQVVEALTKEFEKLPKVTGGIKNAFENLGDNVTTNLARIGKVLDKNLDISSLIDKITNGLDKIVSGFENLSPGMQGFIITSAGVATAIGPILVGLGAFVSLVPTVVSGIGAIKIGLLALTGPIGVAVLAIGGLTTAYFLLRDNQKTSAEIQAEWASSLAKANIEAKNQVSALDGVWKKTQDLNLSTNDRKIAIDELRKMFPAYFQDISNEAILNGTATKSYNNLRTSIVNASRARAAQSELDKRNEERLQTELKLREKVRKAIEEYNNPKAVNIGGGGGAMGANMVKTFDEATIKAQAKNSAKIALEELSNFYTSIKKEDKELLNFISKGSGDIEKVFGERSDAVNTINKSDFAKGTEGWYEEEIKRLQELKKSAIVGSKAWSDLNSLIEKYQKLLSPDKIKPVTIDLEVVKTGSKKGVQNAFGMMFGTPMEMENYMNGLIDTTAVGFGRLNTTVDNSMVTLAQNKFRMDQIINDFNLSLSNMLNEAVVSGIADAFSALGNSMANGESALSSIGKSMLSTLGGVLTQLGKMAITAGLGILGIQTALKSLNPYVALAAGAALVALGGAVTGAVGNLGNSMGSSGGSVGTSNGSNISSQSYSSNYSSGAGGYGGGEVRFRIEGTDLVGVLERNNYKTSRLNAG